MVICGVFDKLTKIVQQESGLSRKDIVESIKDLASHMNALSYVFLIAADVAENL